MADKKSIKILNYCDLGFIDYELAWNLQYQILQKRLDDNIDDTLFLLEHPHTYTLGKVAKKENLLINKNQLQELGIKVYEIDRGGDITYHGPGQIVGYPIIKLSNWKKDTHEYLRSLEEVIMNVCSQFGLLPERNSRYTGVWVGNKKIAAIGIKVSRWVTMHGFAFNINTDLNYFSGIIPCGIHDYGVTSLKNEIGYEIDIQEVKKKILKEFINVFEYSEFIEKSKDVYKLNPNINSYE